MENNQIAYSVRGLTKTFPGTVALDDVDLDVRIGEIHGIIGKNGAGKSVLMTAISGATNADKGTMSILGKSVNLKTYNPKKAKQYGVALIPQEPLYYANMSVMDNMFMNLELKNGLGLIDTKKMVSIFSEITDKLSINVSPNKHISDIQLEDQQLLAFGKALYIQHAKVFLLDEVTASLPKDRKKLFLELLKQSLKLNPEISFTLISHHLSEIMEFCDRVTVLRDGKVVANLLVKETDAKELARYIVGDGKVSVSSKRKIDVNEGEGKASQTPILETENLSKTGSFKNININIYSGKVIGLAGLDGSGKNEFLESLNGMTAFDSGSIKIYGKNVNYSNPSGAMKNGIAYLPKKRETQAIIHNRSVEENTLLPIYSRITNKLGMINRKCAADLVDTSIKYLNVKTPGRKAIIDNLSGGNRQKVVMNRISLNHPKVYVLNEPTRGVDIGAKAEILDAISNKFTENGGVILTSESEEELAEVSDVILVFYKGEIRKQFVRGDNGFNITDIYQAIQGVD